MLSYFSPFTGLVPNNCIYISSNSFVYSTLFSATFSSFIGSDSISYFISSAGCSISSCWSAFGNSSSNIWGSSWFFNISGFSISIVSCCTSIFFFPSCCGNSTFSFSSCCGCSTCIGCITSLFSNFSPGVSWISFCFISCSFFRTSWLFSISGISIFSTFWLCWGCPCSWLCCSANCLALNICSTIVSLLPTEKLSVLLNGFISIVGVPIEIWSELLFELGSSIFKSESFIAWYTALNIKFSSSNLTSNFAGCTFTSTLLGFISIFNTKNPNFPIGNIPLYALSVADDNALSFIYLLLTKNIWYALFERAISGFPTTPVICISSYV